MDRRPHQAAARADLYAAIRAGYKAPILVMPTGGGKTFVACDIIRDVVGRGKRALFVAHRQELVRQTSAKLRELGVQHGIIMAGCIAIRTHAVQVASIQTLRNRIDLYDSFDVVFLDEGHRATSESYRILRERYPHAVFIILTATPWRLDGQGLGVHCGGIADYIVNTVTPRQLIDAGYLVDYEYFAPDQVDTTGMRTVAGEWDQAEAAARVDRPQLIGSIVRHHAAHGRGRPSLIFAASVAHAEHIAAEFCATGLSALCVHAKSATAERQGSLRDLASGALDVAVNVGLWIEGMDCPAISYVGLGALTQSLTRYLQSVGRGFRTAPGKRNLIIMDHANCVTTHGLPDDEREWTLDGRRKRKRGEAEDFPVRQCPKCYRVVRASVAVCTCVHRFADIVRARTIEVADGELEKLDTEAFRAQREARMRQGMARDRDALIAMGNSEARADHIIAARQEKQELRRELAELRRANGIALKGIDDLKPKALRAEIALLSGRMVA